jgi:hypothetical protein
VLVRDFVTQKLSHDFLVPLLGVFNSPDEIDFDSLPDRFILKATHGSGWNVICRNRSSFDRDKAIASLRKWLGMNFFNVGREWAYKDLQPRIICEELLLDADRSIPEDYKIFCFSGEPLYIQVDFDRFSHHKRNFYDPEWNLLPFGLEYPNDERRYPLPELHPELLNAARRLSAGFPFVRVDLYAVRGRVYFGEMTFYPGKGVERFNPRDFDEVLGSKLTLPSDLGK